MRIKMYKNIFVDGLKKELVREGFDGEKLLDEKIGMGVFEDNVWYSNCSDCMVDSEIIEEVDLIIEDYCLKNNVEIIV